VRFLFQNILIDKTRDQILYTWCWWNNKKGMFPQKRSSILQHPILVNRTCEYFFIREDKYNIPLFTPLTVMHVSQLICFGLQRKSIYIRPLILTIICGWLLGRLWDGVDLWYKVDIITIFSYLASDIRYCKIRIKAASDAVIYFLSRMVVCINGIRCIYCL
jgi:hypothetical protein